MNKFNTFIENEKEDTNDQDDIQKIILSAQQKYHASINMKKKQDQIRPDDNLTHGSSVDENEQVLQVVPVKQQIQKPVYSGFDKARSLRQSKSQLAESQRHRNHVMAGPLEAGGLATYINADPQESGDESCDDDTSKSLSQLEALHRRGFQQRSNDQYGSQSATLILPLKHNISKGELDNQNQITQSDEGNMTGCFNSRVRNGHEIDKQAQFRKQMAAGAQEYCFNSQPITGRQDCSSIGSRSINSRNASPMMNRSSRGGRSQKGNIMRSKSQRSVPSVQSNSRSANNRNLDSNSDNSQQTQFSAMFKNLYEQISDLYPSFKNVANTKTIHPRLQPDDLIRAQQVYNQLSFMYNRAIESPCEKQVQKHTAGSDNEDPNQNSFKDQVSIMKFQLENSVRETGYYKKQMDIFKDQLQVAAMREREAEGEYEQRLQFLTDQVNNYEKRIDSMRLKIGDYEKEKLQKHDQKIEDHNVSFRQKQEVQFKSPTVSRNDLYVLTTARDDEDQMKISYLEQELKSLKSKLKNNEDQMNYESETNLSLHRKIETMKLEINADVSLIKQEKNQLLSEIQDKNHTILLLNNQLDSYMNTVAFEFPLVTFQKPQENMPQQINLNNQRAKSQTKQFVSMTAKNGIIPSELERDFEDMLGLKPFAGIDDEDDQTAFNRKPDQKINRGKSTGMKKSTPLNRKKQIQNQKKKSPMFDMFILADCVQTQLSSVMVADEILRDLKESKKIKLTRLDKEIEYHKTVEDSIETMQQEKEGLNQHLKTLTQDNENLKQKFSQLLDQFQEYVNESERKYEEDQVLHKEEQNNLLNELNQNIKELDDMGKNLQQEVEEKDQQIDKLQDEILELQSQLETQHNDNTEQKEEIVVLNNENENLKMHLEQLKTEQSRITMRTKGKSSEALDRSTRKDRSHSQYDNDESHPNAHQFMGRDESQMQDRWQGDTNRQQQQNFQNIHKNSNSRNPFNNGNSQQLTNQPSNRVWREIEPDLVGDNSRNVRSRSYDPITSNENRSESRLQNEQDIISDQNGHNTRGHSYDRQQSSRTAQYMAQPTYDSMKRELVDRERLIDQKNREIVKLRMENDELKSNFEQVDSLLVTKNQRAKILEDIEDVYESLKIELERTKLNLFQSENQAHVPPMYKERKMKLDVITCEDKLITILIERVQSLRSLVTLASEVFLLSSKQKYSHHGNGSKFPIQSPHKMIQISQLEYQELVNDNEMLQRSIQQYEQTLQNLDIINRNCEDDDQVYELKRLTENQLQENLKLQRDIEDLQMKSSQQETFGHKPQNNQLVQENRLLKQEVSMLREKEARNQSIISGNEELLNERRQLGKRVDQLEGEQAQAHMKTQEQASQIKEKDVQLEELRSRITVIAELFEKKPIKQRYSFEVLCDFVHDKAKRLFTKYEAMIKDKKTMQDDKGFKRISQLELEVKSMQDGIETLQKFIIPTVLGMLNKSGHQENIQQLNVNYFKQLLNELDFEYQHLKKEVGESNQTIKRNFEQIKNLEETIGQLRDNQENHPNNGFISQKVNSQKANDLKFSDFEEMKQEKVQLNHKLDEFSNILKEFQVNQQNFEYENKALKQKINQLETLSGVGQNDSLRQTNKPKLSKSLVPVEQTMTVSGQHMDTLGLTGNSVSHNYAISNHSVPTTYIGGTINANNDRASPMKNMM